MKRLKALTIIELIVALLISSIVIATAFLAVLFVNRQFYNHTNKSERNIEFQMLDKIINDDMANTTSIKDSSDSKMLCFTKGKNQIVYAFADSVVFRLSGDGVDKFNVKCFLKSYDYISDSLPLIGSFSLGYTVDEIHFHLRYIKKYTATEMLEFEPNEK